MSIGRWVYFRTSTRAKVSVNWDDLVLWAERQARKRPWLRRLLPVTPYRPWLCRRPGEGWDSFAVRIERTCKPCGAEFDTPQEVPPHAAECRGPDAEAALWGEH